VSRAIDRIEARLGVRLLLRSTRALTLTAEGQAYLQMARRILADLDDAEQQIADQGAPRGRLRINAALSHGRLCVVPLLGDFAALYPHIVVDIALTDTLVDVAGGQADVAIRFGPLADSTLTARKLGETRRVIVAAPSYLAQHGTPQVPEDLYRFNCLNFNFRRVEPVWPFRRDGRDYAVGQGQHRGQQWRNAGATGRSRRRRGAGRPFQRRGADRFGAVGAHSGRVQPRRCGSHPRAVRRRGQYTGPHPRLRRFSGRTSKVAPAGVCLKIRRKSRILAAPARSPPGHPQDTAVG
jgi:hypothetical protein